MDIEKVVDAINYDNMDWEKAVKTFNFSEDILRRYKDKLIWFDVFYYQKLSEGFIEEFVDNVKKSKHGWLLVSARQKLSENFIRRHKDKVWWTYISANQSLSEKFIEEFKDNVNWLNISARQKISKNFIKKHAKDLDVKFLMKNSNLSFEDYNFL